MNRALFSGVSGLKAHQTRMDVIGNNIANVNTYGYKSQRVVFSDVMYQALNAASGGTSTSGGTNPSTIGYGSTVAAIQTNTSQGSMQTTSYSSDCAISGEGYFQVMDGAGNIYYTKAGIFNVDDNGYLVDENGNFVLGADSKDGDPDSQKINVANVGSISAAQPSATFKLNGITYTLKASNSTTDGNVAVSFASSTSLADGLRAKASISSTGAISITLNANEKFSNLADLTSAINQAITEANGGKAIAAGTLTLTADTDFSNLTGAQICGSDFGVTDGTIKLNTTNDALFGVSNITVSDTSSGFTGSGDLNFTAAYSDNGTSSDDSDDYWTITAGDYSAKVSADSTASTILMKKNGTSDTDYFEMTNPTFSALTSYYETQNSATSVPTGTTMYSNGTATAPTTADATATASADSNNLGLKSAAVTLSGGTKGGDVTLSDITVSIGSDGKVYATADGAGTTEIGGISLANFGNPSGLEQIGSNYFSSTVNSGDPELCTPGENGTGELKTSALEMSNVDLSSEMADMITTQRGFQANARVITVSDTMLEELINLKRS